MKTIISILAIGIIFSGCSVSMPITYPTDDVETNFNPSLQSITFDIEDFRDRRFANVEDNAYLGQNQVCKIEGHAKCINAEMKYKKDTTVVHQISSMLVSHLNQRQSFERVVINNKENADFYLTGEIISFKGQQDFSRAAAAGQSFGLIGVLATANAKTHGVITFEIQNLKIYDREDSLVKDLGTFKKVYEQEYPADANCFCVYLNVNNMLKEYFSELITLIESEVANIKE